MLPTEDIIYHIRGCASNSRESQQWIYKSFYGYGMAICERYTKNREDAMEILNDSFLKIFQKMHSYQPSYADVVRSFRGWMRKIIVYTAIDHFRRNSRHKMVVDLDDLAYRLPSVNDDIMEKMDHEKVFLAIRDLSPGYRVVFNLHVIDGLSHEEIAEKLGISIGTSKSNLSKARKQLQGILFKQDLFPERVEN